MASSRISAADSFSAMAVICTMLSTAACFCSSERPALLMISSSISLFFALVCSFRSLASERIPAPVLEGNTASPGVSPSSGVFPATSPSAVPSTSTTDPSSPVVPASATSIPSVR